MTIDKARRRKAIARWHRRFAILVSVWLVVLALSGLLINHAHDWGFDRKPLAGTLQQWVYGIETSNEEFCEPLAREGIECAGLFARLSLPAGALLLGEHHVFLLDNADKLVEKLSVSQFGLGRLQAGLLDGSEIYLRDAQKTVRTHPDLMDSRALDGAEVSALNGHDWRVDGGSVASITWERFLLDLHAARFLGPLAKFFNDLMAALILVLAVSGLWLYVAKRNSNGNGN